MPGPEPEPETKGKAEHKKEGGVMVKARAPMMKNVIEIFEEIVSENAGKKVSYTQIKDTLTNYLKAKDESAIKKIAENELDNLPFGMSSGGAVGLGAASVQPLVPVEIPSLLEMAQTKFHPKGYPAAKKGIFDVIAGIDTIGESFKGDRWRYVKERIKSSDGTIWIRLKDKKGSLIPAREKLLLKKLKKINDAYEAFAAGNISEDALFKEIDELVEVDLFKKDANEVWKNLDADIKAGKVDMAVVPFRGKDQFELSFKKNNIRWTITAEFTKDAGKVKFGKAFNFFAVAPVDALKKAQKIMDKLEYTSMRYQAVFKKNRIKAFFVNKKAVLTKAGAFVPPRNPHYVSLFLGGLGGAALDGFLEGVTALSQGQDVSEALKRAAFRSATSFAIGTGMAVTLNTLGKWGVKKAVNYAVKKGVSVAATKAATAAGTKVIPFVGAVLTAWDVGWTAGRVFNNLLVKGVREYEANCRVEYEEVEKAFVNEKDFKEYFEVESGLKIRRPRWRFTGPPIASDVPYSYDTVPRSVRLEKDGYIIEYGEELLLPYAFYDFLPFCRYLPKIEEKGQSRELYQKLLGDLNQIYAKLEELKDCTEWLYDVATGMAKTIIMGIESCKQWVAIYDSHLNTKWAHLRTPEESEMYLWCDRTGQSYAWAGTEGEFESDPKKASEAKDTIEGIRKALGIS